GGHLSLIWEDARTRYALRIPHDDGQPFEFEASDARGGDSFPSRLVAAEALDVAERKTRIEDKQPLTRIPRRFEIGWTSPPGFVSLEMTQEQANASLPRGQSVIKQTGPDFINVLVAGDPPRTAVRVVRHAFIRFGPNQKVAEIRLRYAAGPAGSN